MKLLSAFLILVLAFSVLQIINAAPFTVLTDQIDPVENGKSIKFSILSKKNESGDWVTSFAVLGNSMNNLDAVKLDLMQTVTQENKEDTILFQGTFGLATSTLTEKEQYFLDGGAINPIGFHERNGNNIRLSNNGRTAERIRPRNEFDDAIVTTNRTLKDNELFEVRLEEVVTDWLGSLEFGVTSKKPTELPLLDYHGHYSEEYTWFYGSQDFEEEVSDKDYQVGDRFGVMRTPNGDLQYFYNGKIVGTAPSKVPKEVYGIIDLYASGVKATIINPPVI